MKMVMKSALCAALALTGSAAFAIDHEVRMERYGYFPNTIYVSTGDTITFVNMTPNWANISSDDGEDDLSGYDSEFPCSQEPSRYDGSKDGWTISWFAKNSSRTIDVTSCMETTIYPPSIYRYSFNSSKYRATIVFGDAPNGS